MKITLQKLHIYNLFTKESHPKGLRAVISHGKALKAGHVLLTRSSQSVYATMSGPAGFATGASSLGGWWAPSGKCHNVTQPADWKITHQPDYETQRCYGVWVSVTCSRCAATVAVSSTDYWIIWLGSLGG